VQPDETAVPITCTGCGSTIPAKSARTRNRTTFRCEACSSAGPAKLARLIRRRYPNTAIVTLYTMTAVTALWFSPVRKAGELMLGLLAVTVAVVAMARLSRPRI
jgi:cobalamin synthase